MSLNKTLEEQHLKRGQELEIIIEKFAFGGNGISKFKTSQGDYILFTQNAIPGQKVKVRISKKKKSYAQCKLLEVIKKAETEIDIEYQSISGAPYITLPISLQHKFKTETTFDIFERIGKLNNVNELFDEFISSPNSHHYRNKMEYSFSTIRHDINTNEELDDEFALGFKHRGTWWKVENLDKDSGMFDNELENKLKDIRIYLENTGFKAWHPPKKHGFFRHLVVRKSYAKDLLLFNLVISNENKNEFKALEFGKFLQELFKNRFAGLIVTINNDVADRAKLEKGGSNLILGQESITENILGLSFEISMASFFQTNPLAAEKLYSKVIELASINLKTDATIMDLFCGTGTIGQLLASKLTNANIIGVDIVESSIINARKNAEINNINNVKFFAEDVGKFLLHNPEYNNKIDIIILDPPRAGIAPKTLKKVLNLNANKIVYVSCNPATQIRDTFAITDAGFKLKSFSLVDQFPHTHHIESIMLFEK